MGYAERKNNGRAAALVAVPIIAVLATWAVAADSPSLRIFYTANVKGYIDQCGCRVNPSGGVSRRTVFLDSVSRDGVSRLLIDGGSLVGTSDDVGRTKTSYLFRAMKTMGYHTIAASPRDFLYGLEYLREAEREYGFTFVCANLIDDATGARVFAPYAVENVGGTEVGIVGVMGVDRPPLAQPTDPTLRMTDALGSVRDAVAVLRERTDVIVVLAYVSPEELQSVIAIDDVDVVIATRLGRRPSQMVAEEDGVVVGHSTTQGKGVGRIDLTIDDGAVRFTEGAVTMLTASVGDDSAMVNLLRQFDEWNAANIGEGD